MTWKLPVNRRGKSYKCSYCLHWESIKWLRYIGMDAVCRACMRMLRNIFYN